MDQTSWEAAENQIREWIKAGRINASVKLTTVADAVKLVLAEAESRNLADASLRLYRRFIGRQWPIGKAVEYLKEGDERDFAVKIRTEKTGGIWHGYLEEHPEVDERGLTEEIAR